jgi:predicted ArsR family transcriptional regulator
LINWKYSGTVSVATGRDELAAPWDQRFFRSTRGRIVTLLRRCGRTVEELARELGLTDNGVRAHLATLERDGVIRQRGSVRRGSGGGKPAYVYELTPEAEDLFPKAYEPVLRQLLGVLSERLGPEGSEAVLRMVGRRLAEEHGVSVDGTRSRLEAAVGVLNELGGLAELEERDGDFVIRGYSCPLTSVVPDHPEVCRMAEALLAELTGLPIHEHCDRGESPRCCFEVAHTHNTEQK